MQAYSWQLQEAKSKFSHLVDQAVQHKPQVVSKHGKNTVVVLSFDDYEKLIKPKKDLVSFLQNSPLAEIELDVERNKDLPRDFEL